MYQVAEFPKREAPYLRSVVELFAAGIEEEPFGWHGTNIEAMYYLAQYGRLPLTGCFGKDFYFVPSSMPAQNNGTSTAKTTATASAIQNVRAAYVARRFPDYGANNPRELFFSAVDDYRDEDDDKRVISSLLNGAEGDKTIEDFQRVREEGIQHGVGAVLLGISQDILQFPTRHIGPNQSERVVRTDDRGVSIAQITGIEPLDQYAWDQLVLMQAVLEVK